MQLVGALNTSEQSTPLWHWRHYCLAANLSSGDWAMAVQGEITIRDQGDIRLINKSIDGDGVLILGQDQDVLGGGFQEDQSLSGEITALHIWDYALDDVMINDIANFQSNLQEKPRIEHTNKQTNNRTKHHAGNVVSWLTSSWEMHGEVEIRDLPREMVTQMPITHIMMADPKPFPEATHLCSLLKGKMSAPASERENELLHNHTMSYYPLCKNNLGHIYLWVGYSDVREEGVWEDSGTGQKLSYPGSWNTYEPNGYREENCVSMFYSPGRWVDVTCFRTLCWSCQFTKLTEVKVLGLCKNSVLDLHYVLAGDKNGYPHFTGSRRSHIFWSPENQTYVMQSLWNNQTYGVMKKRGGGTPLPIGSHTWSFSSALCSGRPSTLKLTLSACSSGYFTCGDGSCVAFNERCDRRTNCNDYSDEEDCSVLSLQQITDGYRPEIPPPSIDNGTALNVLVRVYVVTLTSINTVNMEFTADFILQMRWYDARLFFENLKDETDLNALTQTEKKSIWVPTLSFKSARGNRRSLLDEETKVYVLKRGQPIPSDMTFVHEIEVYNGRTAQLLLERKYHVLYGCTFELQMYPFDTQICTMSFQTQSATKMYVKLVADYVTFLGRRQLVEYVVGDVTMVDVNDNSSYSSLKLDMVLIRQSGYHLVTTYLPTSIMIVIAYITFYFKVHDFNDRVMVSLTSLLVLSSLLTQTSETLPKTSYFKMVDIWLFFCIVIIFMVILIHTASICVQDDHEICTMDDQSDRNDGSNDRFGGQVRAGNGLKKLHVMCKQRVRVTPTFILTFGKISIPFVVGVFNIIYWSLALTK
ncbi:uncharacterized protein LOC125042554 [Penaeus chinensis]|uniref:uncharacterized protein LOC125042554 n=1 Tax=Penaeus chinensis TaxID=139456 RepID=UPI001FB634C1|nr:uncharacterized protein LOC125042554 [Penaeus chinensis]